MGNTLVIYRVFPNEAGNEDKIIAGLKQIKIGEIKDIKKEPLAFGMYLIRVGILFPEKQEKMEEFEKAVLQIKEVSDVRVEGMTLL